MEKIAIIGLSCLFPDAQTPEQFWQNLLQGKSSVSRATEKVMGIDPDILYDPNKGRAGATGTYYCKHGGFIKDFQFDPRGYRLPASLLESLDCVHQWSLYVAKQALEDSGYLDDFSTLAKCGLILGNLSPPTQLSQRLVAQIYHKAIDPAVQKLLQNSNFSLANNLSRSAQISPLNFLMPGYPSSIVAQALSLSGGHFAIDAACASSLYAIKLASQYLLSGKADLMLAGAVSRTDPVMVNTGFSVFQAYPEDDRSKPLDASSSGLNTGEGAGMVVLKRYSDAVRDNDRIYGKILGLGLSNDGQGKHFLSPNPKGQILAFERTYKAAGIDPKTIDYVECHATGTPLGDRTELNSMEEFFGKHDAAPLVGSVKSNLGHLLTAAGMPSIIKTILSMERGVIPATINVREALSSANGTISNRHIVSKLTPWPNQSTCKRVGISAFGFGGTNSHLIIEQERESRGYSELLSGGEDRTGISSDLIKMAIVGMDAFFADCDNLAKFERHIHQGKQSFIPVPKERWRGIETQPQVLEDYGLNGKAPEGGYIENFEMDYLKFKILPDATDNPIPQQLLILKVAKGAIEDAGLSKGANVATIVAMSSELSIHASRASGNLSWQVKKSLKRAGIVLPPDKLLELEQLLKDSLHKPVGVNQMLSYIGNIMASRISSHWDFSGPAFTLSAEENSVFRALEVAQLLLADPNLDAVTIGAIDLAGGVENILLRQKISPVNQGKQTLSFDRDANGTIVGEGAGAIVVKRLDRAREKQDKIYAVIDGISLVQNNAEAIAHLPKQPKAELVTQACQEACAKAEITPAQIGYLEVYGSGVAAEDEAEIQGVLKAYSNSSSPLSCAIGSVKATIGHTYSASGMASLIKTALCLYNEYIPATPQWSAPKQPEIWKNSPFYVATESRHWYLSESISQRTAAINSLGLDGACAHAILSEEVGHRNRSSDYLQQIPLFLLPIAANDFSNLLIQLARLETAIDECDSLSTTATQIATEFQQKSEAIYALAIVGRSQEEIKREIDRARQGVVVAFETGEEWKTPLGSYFTPRPLAKKGGVAFVYPGGFNSYIGMGKDIYHLFPRNRDRLDSFIGSPTAKKLFHSSSSYIYPRSMQRLSRKALEKKEMQLMNDAVAMLLSGAALALGYTEIVRSYFGIEPQFAFGYSLGELSMMFALDVWQKLDKLAERLDSSPIFQSELSGNKNILRQLWNLSERQENIWGAYVLMSPLNVREVIETLKRYPRVYLTHINSSEEVVIGGEHESCLSLIKELGCNYFLAPFDHIIHCNVVNPLVAEISDWFDNPLEQKLPIEFYCADNYEALDSWESKSIGYKIASSLSKTLDFPRLVEKAYDDGARIFLELGSGNACSRSIGTILKDREHTAMAINSRASQDEVSVVKVLAQLLSHRVSLDLSPLYVSCEAISLSKKKTLLKTLTLGGCPLEKNIVTKENCQKFASVATRKPELVKTNTKAEIKVPIAVGAVSPKANIGISKASNMEQNPPTTTKITIRNSQHPNNTFSRTPEPKDNYPQLASPSTLGESDPERVELVNSQSVLNQTHLNFLESRQEGLRQLGKMIEMFISTSLSHSNQSQEEPLVVKPPKPENVIFERAELVEFAEGKIAPVFGKEYEIIDSYPRRVRLPMPPYMFISRVTKFTAKLGCYEPCEIETEYDIPTDAWYVCGDGCIPCAIPFEASHGSILLVTYMGIDFDNKGERCYRALGGETTFVSELPKAGETLRCVTRINSFIHNNGTLLYFFNCDYFVGDRKFLKLKAGAGLFLEEELKKGQGVTLTKNELAQRSKIQKQKFEPLLHCSKSTFDVRDLENLHLGNLASCFGEHYDQQGQNNPSLRLPPPAIRMLDRVISVDNNGGPWGLGLLVGEKDLDPQAWYFNCHFKDDLCLPGTLVLEGASQLLLFYTLYLGLPTKTKDAHFEPVMNYTQSVRSRGQVTPTSSKLTYQLEIFEIGLEPKPYIKANTMVIFEGKTIMFGKNISVQLSEKHL
jgi:PfaB family protein